MRRCGRCGIEKPLEEFAWHRRAQGKRQHHCRSCQQVYRRAHYLANREKYIAKARRNKERLALERTRFLIEYFKSHPCLDCGETDPVVLEFDHLRDKQFNIGQDLYTRRWLDVLAEIEKCEVVCANCHRRRTALRRGVLRVLLTDPRTDKGPGEPGPPPCL